MTAVAGFAVKGLIPGDLPAKIGADAIESILQILASSMLAVTTFSLSILTAAYAAAGRTATPRAVPLLVSDSVSQTVLATFIGAFVFSLVSIILLKTEIYGESGRLILFAVTLLVVLIVIASLLRWIDRLGRLGRVGDTLVRVSHTAEEAFCKRLEAPWLGANPLRGAVPERAVPIFVDRVGHVQHCDIPALSRIAEENELLIYLEATPGDFIHPAAAALHVEGLPADPDKAGSLRDKLCGCLTIRDRRDFRQDPRFGLQVLSEIAQRALSPAVNDPGTANLAAEQIFKVLSNWRDETAPVVEFRRLFIPSLTASNLLEDAFLPIARDGADNWQVQRKLQNLLLGLSRLAPGIFAKVASDLSAQMLAMQGDRVANAPQAGELTEISQDIAVIAQSSSGKS